MTERVLLLLARPSVLDALQNDEALETLSDISPLSDHYLPMLQFLMRPDNLVALVFCLLEEPPRGRDRHEGVEPSYDEYAMVFRAHWVLCASGFSPQLLSALLALQPQPQQATATGDEHYHALCERLVSYYSRDAMTLEALTRFLNVFMDQFSPEALIAFLGPAYELRFMQSLLVLVHYEPVRDVLLRLCNELPDSITSLRGLTTQLLCQLAPERVCCGYLDDDAIVARVKHDPPCVQFSRMIFTCDLLTDLIHERRQRSLGHHFVHELNHSESHIAHLLDAAMRDLEALPTQMANESYVIKVLNSLLQQTQCGCVSKIAFSAAFARQSEASGEPPVDDALLSPHVDLPLVWKRLIARLPELLGFLSIPVNRRYRPSHVQMIYLMLPILNVSCTVVDRKLIRHGTMEGLLELIVRFPQANILHCAISRLFIVALEDSPFMFGKELPAFRAANDPLRLHMLLKGCFELVVSVYDRRQEDDAGGDASTSAPHTQQQKQHAPPPAFVDIAISFDQAVTNAHAHSPHLFPRAVMDRWHAFRSRVLLPTQTQWEEQSGQVAQAGPTSPLTSQAFMDGINEPFDLSDGVVVLPVAAVGAKTSATKADGQAAAADHVEGLVVPADEIATPLSALYNDEEKHLMLRVAGASECGGKRSDADPVAVAMPITAASS